MTIELNDVTYQPLSMIAHNSAGLQHPVYVTGRWSQFTNKGKQVQRVVKVASGFLKYVVFNKGRYYIDDACTLR